MLVPAESSSAVLVISSKSVPICNHSRARLVDRRSRNRTFSRGYPNLTRSYGGLLERKGSNHSTYIRLRRVYMYCGQTLHRWNLRLMPNISYAGCPGLSWMVLAQFTSPAQHASRWRMRGSQTCRPNKVVLVYFEWFRRNSLWKCVCQAKIAKNSLKPHILGVQGHRCWYHWKARQQCLLWYAASLCLSATIFTLDEPIVVK